MRQPPTGDKNKYQDQQRSNEGRAVVAAVGWLRLERERVVLLVDVWCMPDIHACVFRRGAGSLCRVIQSMKLLDPLHGHN
jgi:hypothetical protein